MWWLWWSRKTPSSNPVPSLPDDLMLNVLARVSRWHYPSLSLVSKRFRSLIASPELYKTRSLLGRTETCLYVCLEFDNDSHTRWLTLRRKPDRTLTKNSSDNLLVQIPSPRFALSQFSCVVSLNSNIYKIGGPVEHQPSTSVWILDCRSHTWSEAPSMTAKRLCSSAGVADGKIYVAGGCEEYLNPIEVFDPKTQTWDLVSIPNGKLSPFGRPRSACIDGKYHLMLGKETLAYDPKENKWDLVQGEMAHNSTSSSFYCVIENVLYCYYKGELNWYDTKVRLWKKLKGLVGLPKFSCDPFKVTFADYGGKMAVLWEKNSRSSGYKKMIWCAEITLERRHEDEIWGIVEWLAPVLPVPDSFFFVKVLATTL